MLWWVIANTPPHLDQCHPTLRQVTFDLWPLHELSDRGKAVGHALGFVGVVNMSLKCIKRRLTVLPQKLLSLCLCKSHSDAHTSHLPTHTHPHEISKHREHVWREISGRSIGEFIPHVLKHSHSFLQQVYSLSPALHRATVHLGCQLRVECSNVEQHTRLHSTVWWRWWWWCGVGGGGVVWVVVVWCGWWWCSEGGDDVVWVVVVV